MEASAFRRPYPESVRARRAKQHAAAARGANVFKEVERERARDEATPHALRSTSSPPFRFAPPTRLLMGGPGQSPTESLGHNGADQVAEGSSVSPKHIGQSPAAGAAHPCDDEALAGSSVSPKHIGQLPAAGAAHQCEDEALAGSSVSPKHIGQSPAASSGHKCEDEAPVGSSVSPMIRAARSPAASAGRNVETEAVAGSSLVSVETLPPEMLPLVVSANGQDESDESEDEEVSAAFIVPPRPMLRLSCSQKPLPPVLRGRRARALMRENCGGQQAPHAAAETFGDNSTAPQSLPVPPPPLLHFAGSAGSSMRRRPNVVGPTRHRISRSLCSRPHAFLKDRQDTRWDGTASNSASDDAPVERLAFGRVRKVETAINGPPVTSAFGPSCDRGVEADRP